MKWLMARISRLLFGTRHQRQRADRQARQLDEVRRRVEALRAERGVIRRRENGG